MLSRPEFRPCGATFRVRQSAKDGRSRLQLCPSAPEYRSVSTNKLSKVFIFMGILIVLFARTYW